VKCAEQFDAAVTVSRDGNTVPGTSIMGLMMLAASPGSTILVSASGRQASEALDALEALVTGRFGEE
jgi:phosphocarrier protein